MTASILPTYLLLLVVLSLALPAQAMQVAGIHIADQAIVSGSRLQLNGGGVRRLFGFRVYVAALYLPKPIHEAAAVLERDLPKRMQITLLRDASTQRNLDALKSGLIDNNSASELEAIKSQVDHFLALLQQVEEIPEGSEIELDYLPGTGTSLRIGSRDLGTIPGERFNRALLKIWLGSHPIQLSLKQSLLGNF